MNDETLKNIGNILSILDTKYELDLKDNWVKGSETFLEEITKEIIEVREEYFSNKNIRLEDELGDVFWDYILLLFHLHKEERINLPRVFQRAHKKYKERIDGINNNVSWSETKLKQKKELHEEQERA